MNDSANLAPKTAKPVAASSTEGRQRRFGHPSTWAILALGLVVLLVANIPGEFNRISSENVREIDILHGWPWTHLRRTLSPIPFVDPGLVWRIGDEPKTFYPVAALGNLAVGILILIAFGMLVEWRRRRRKRVWQISLFEAFAAVLLLATASAVWGWLLKETDRQIAAVAAISGDGNLYARWESPLPDWWTSLEPAAGDPRPGYVVAIAPWTILGSSYITAPDATPILRSLPQFPQLSGLEIGGFEIQNPDALENLSACRNLQSLGLCRTRLNDVALDHLAHVSTLVDLDLSYNNITDAGLNKLQVLKQLKHLNLMGNEVSVEAMEALQQALPGLEITHGPMPRPENDWRIWP